MTNEQIDALDGVALRVAVAEALGWTHGDYLPWEKQSGRNGWIGRAPDGAAELVPDWPADIGDAWGLLDDGEFSVWGDAASANCETSIGEEGAAYNCPSVPVAICRACLKAKAETK